ncbi:MAG: hypothetical protein ACOCY6_05525 [Halodesulfurarchaeum sp.]
MKLSRRQLLAAIGAIGTAGVVAGSGTAAVLHSKSGFENSIQTGVLDLAVTYDILDGPGADDPTSNHGTVNGSRLEIPIATLSASEPVGSTLVTFGPPADADRENNPAGLWIATDCPIPAATGLAEAITLSINTADCDTGEVLQPIYEGSVRAVGEALQTGRRIDGNPNTEAIDCLRDTVCLRFDYELEGYFGDESVDLPLWFAAVQCRNEQAVNPFADRPANPCPTGDDCPCCQTLGKLEFEEGTPGIGDSFIEPGTYAFAEGDQTYGLEIYATETKDAGQETTGVAFRLRNLSDPTAAVPRLCTVAVKGGPGFTQYDGDETTQDDTAGLLGTDGIVSAPDGYAISHVTVCVCITDTGNCEGCSDPSLPGLQAVGPLLEPEVTR